MQMIILILAGMWAWSYIRFRRNARYNQTILDVAKYNYQRSMTPSTRCELASALMLCCQYASAARLFRELLADGQAASFPFLRENIDFCEHPLPWGDWQAKNLEQTWLHSFLLARFGRRRMPSISNGTLLQVSASLRADGRGC